MRFKFIRNYTHILLESRTKFLEMTIILVYVYSIDSGEIIVSELVPITLKNCVCGFLVLA